MKNSTYSRRSQIVSTAKKSHATIPVARWPILGQVKGRGLSLQWLESSGCQDRPQQAPCPVGRARTLAQVYRHFGEVDAAGTSPLYERVAVALSESDEALRAIEAVPARKRHPG
jgi:Uncharacterized protein conserved in bacteria (DUF2332)